MRAAKKTRMPEEATASGGISRRGVLGGVMAGLATLPAAVPAHAAPRKPAPAAPAAGPAAAPILSAARSGHGVGAPRGSDIAITAGRAKEGRFGVMFKKLPAFAPSDELLADLAQQMVDRTPPLADVSLSNDGFDNPDIPAGYAYLGQFIDHDMTLDRTPMPLQEVDPKGLTNFDTPFFELGSVYGRGPAADPQLYEPADPRRLRIGRNHDGFPDLPRNPDGMAVIGDHRNDENLIVAQFHLTFLQLHNKLVDEGRTFDEAQRLVRWHFQWLIVHDFLPRIAGKTLVGSMLRPRRGGPTGVDCKFYKPGNLTRPMMPIEYSVAAYRFGHSMIRAEYEMHDAVTIPFFGNPSHDLRGSRPLPTIARADWNYFFDVPGMSVPDDRNMTRLIDTKLALPLDELPPTVVQHVDGAILSLAHRNLLRGKRLGLPAGQDVARAMGVAPIPNDRLGLTDPRWNGRAPLWFYVLKEAELLGGRTLGPVGGRIVAEVILGILSLDRTSFLNAPNGWAPERTPFQSGDFLEMAGALENMSAGNEDEGAEDDPGAEETEASHGEDSDEEEPAPAG
ncbi:peroxidase [Kocuria sediminis]|uniref:Peroxidase n=1 Tax=Kocuria sediminis TaxID=1038857 RepID=A0A6N8GJD4_9MICC|nr:heme peroxidase family protein [Kocuria sediminis]MUN63221.1 peroxidase [Kocuria sediminis]